MALLFMDGFDLYDSFTDMITGDRWDTWVGSGITLDQSAGRFGGSALIMDNQGTFIRKVIPELKTGIIHAAFQNTEVAGSGVFFQVLDLNEGVLLDINVLSSQQLQVRRNGVVLGTSFKTIANDTWYWLGFKFTIDNTVGAFEVRINNENWVSDFSIDTQAAAFGVVSSVKFRGLDAFQACRWDDVMILDTTGAQNNDFLEDHKIEALTPDGDATPNDMTPTGAGSDNKDRILTGDEDTTYISTSTVNDIDLFSVTSLTTTNILTIDAVQVVSYAKKTEAGPRTYRNKFKKTGTFNGTTRFLSDSYEYFADIFELDPDDSGAWTVADVDAIVVGVELDG